MCIFSSHAIISAEGYIKERLRCVVIILTFRWYLDGTTTITLSVIQRVIFLCKKSMREIDCFRFRFQSKVFEEGEKVSL